MAEKFSVYIDDTGTTGYQTPYSKALRANPPPWDEANANYWRQNYFALCAVRVSQSDIKKINEDINKLKLDTFGTSEIEIKSTRLRIPFERKKYFKDPFQLSDDAINKFGEAYIDYITSNADKIKIISAVFDKRGIKQRTLEEFNPLKKTSQLIFERICKCGGENFVIFDQMDSTLSVKKGRSKEIDLVYKQNDGMINIYHKDYSTHISGLKVASSKEENLLQVADVCGYIVYSQFLEHGREWLGTNVRDGKKVLDCNPYFLRIWGNFDYYTYGGRKIINGAGVKLFPDFEKLNWT